MQSQDQQFSGLLGGIVNALAGWNRVTKLFLGIVEFNSRQLRSQGPLIQRVLKEGGRLSLTARR